MPFAAAVSATRALLGASHEDLRLRAHQLSHELSGAFFDRQAAAARPFAAVCGATARFPEDGLYVCADLPPLGPALQDVQRALVQVAVQDASHGACDLYFDTIGHVMRLLVVGDAGDGRGPAVFDRSKFEVVLAVKWVDMD
jgi:putative intracellular protease/amidase